MIRECDYGEVPCSKPEWFEFPSRTWRGAQGLIVSALPGIGQDGERMKCGLNGEKLFITLHFNLCYKLGKINFNPSTASVL